MHVSCSCDLHHHCDIGYVEDAFPRARLNGSRWVACPNQIWHDGGQGVDVRPFLQQVRSLGRSTSATDESAMRDRIVNADHLLQNATSKPPETMDFSRCATET